MKSATALNPVCSAVDHQTVDHAHRGDRRYSHHVATPRMPAAVFFIGLTISTKKINGTIIAIYDGCIFLKGESACPYLKS